MTKFTVAFITMLVAGVVPFGKAICDPGEVGLGQQTNADVNPVSSTHIRKMTANNNAKIEGRKWDLC